MERQPVTDAPDDDAEAPFVTAREHLRQTAAYLAADIAKRVPVGEGETIDSRLGEVLGAADKVFAWLTAGGTDA